MKKNNPSTSKKNIRRRNAKNSKTRMRTRTNYVLVWRVLVEQLEMDVCSHKSWNSSTCEFETFGASDLFDWVESIGQIPVLCDTQLGIGEKRVWSHPKEIWNRRYRQYKSAPKLSINVVQLTTKENVRDKTKFKKGESRLFLTRSGSSLVNYQWLVVVVVRTTQKRIVYSTAIKQASSRAISLVQVVVSN